MVPYNFRRLLDLVRLLMSLDLHPGASAFRQALALASGLRMEVPASIRAVPLNLPPWDTLRPCIDTIYYPGSEA